jgi:hypothetical protein
MTCFRVTIVSQMRMRRSTNSHKSEKPNTKRQVCVTGLLPNFRVQDQESRN